MFGEQGLALGKYRLIAEIARGGMGIVYLAMVQGPGGFNKLVVVKELKPELVEEPVFLQMFLDEAKLAARLNHPNIVQTNEVGNDGERYFMAMDYLDGRGLDRVRRRAHTAKWGPSMPMLLRIAADMLAGLDYAHKLNDFDGSPLAIVHRDISPSNVFITFDGQVKLLDFGIAKTVESMHETRAGVLKGKLSYMAPEQARGQKVDARSDVFSAGVLLWESLAGKKMRKAGNEADLLASLDGGDLPRVSSVKPWIPTELDEICARATAMNPAERYQSAKDFGDAIEHYLTTTNANISARDVGACISDLFREDRAATNALIESHIARTRTESATPKDELPIIELSYEPHSSSLDTPVVGAGGPQSQSISIPQPATLTSHIEKTTIEATGGTNTGSPISTPARKSRTLVIGGVALGVLALAGIAYAVHGSGSAGPVAPAPDPIAITAPRPDMAQPPPPPPGPHPIAPATQPTSIDVNIKVTPPNASVTVDEVNLPSNPFHRKYISDAATHQIRASAPGYLPKVTQVTFDANVTLDVSLERAPVPVTRGRVVAVRPVTPPPPVEHLAPTLPLPVTPPPATPVGKPAPSPAEINPAGGIKPRRPIESTNPYGAK